MLPRQYRLVGEKNIDQLKKSGRIYKGKFVAIIVRTNEELSCPKVVFVVSLKVSKKAVERNRAKRLLSGILLPVFPVFKKNCELLFLVKGSFLKASKQELEKDVLRLLQISKIL